MKNRKLNFLVISFLMIFVVSGCAGIQITRSSDLDKAVLKSKRIFFEKIGKIDQYPDNVDGFLNLLWTNDAEKKSS